MTFGMRIKGPTGVVELDETSFTMRVVYSEIITPQTWGAKFIDISIPGITPQNAAAFPTPIQAVNSLYDAQVEPEILNGVVRVWRTIKGDPYNTSAITTTRQRLTVVRFK